MPAKSQRTNEAANDSCRLRHLLKLDIVEIDEGARIWRCESDCERNRRLIVERSDPAEVESRYLKGCRGRDGDSAYRSSPPAARSVRDCLSGKSAASRRVA